LSEDHKLSNTSTMNRRVYNQNAAASPDMDSTVQFVYLNAYHFVTEYIKYQIYKQKTFKL